MQYCSNGTTVANYGSVTYEGKTYKTVVIGTQTWMAENLNYAVEDSKCYNNIESNCTTYGRLYNWATVMALPSSCNSTYCASQINANHKGICPSGWHIPSNADWNVLMKFVDLDCSDNSECPYAGTKLKANSVNTSSSYMTGTDNYGFSALPGGFGSNGGSGGYWWSASEGSSDGAYSRGMDSYDDVVYWSIYNKDYLFSVRCLQD
jgi:uncharacterized protein (TIGR02145 family)